MSEGQRNQGFTCYLDSLPQCLFFTPEFREAILSWNNAGDSHIMAPFKSQFEMLTTDNSLTEETIIQWLKAEVCNTWDWCQECRANQVLSVCKGGAQPHSSSFMQPGACSKPHCLGISERSENVTNPRQNVQVQLDIMKCFQLVMSKISEDKEEIQQVETVQAPTYHGGRNLMVLEKCTLKCSSFLDKCTPGPVYSVRSCFETVPQMLFIHLKKDQVVGSRADVPGLLTLNLEAEEQLDANYELFAACYHSKGIQEDWNVTEIKLPGNGFFYWVSDTEVQKVSGQPASTTPGSRYCSGMGNSAAVSLLLYHKVKSDARPSRYVGLQNQGSTCYLNSLLQCLFFTPELSKSILSCENVPDSSIVCQLKKLFDKLNHKKSAPSTENITRCLGVTNVHQQQDVAEYFRILMNKIIDDKQEIQKMYQVEMVHSITCQKCQKETKIKENPVLSLSLSLYQWTSKQEAYSVARALDDVQKINYFTGDEQLYCETCKSKEDAESRYRFETLPPILVLVLKRYRFGGDGFRKLHCNVSAPLALHVKLDHTQSSQIINYELFAVCHHQGGIHGGHYVAEIKPFKSDCWYYFNDTTVTEAPEEQNTMGTKNSHTAYLLMYRSENSAVCQVQSNPGNPDAAEPSNVILATKDEALEPALSLFDAGKGTSGKETKNRKIAKGEDLPKPQSSAHSKQRRGNMKGQVELKEMEFDGQVAYQRALEGEDNKAQHELAAMDWKKQKATAGGATSPKIHTEERLCQTYDKTGALTQYFMLMICEDQNIVAAKQPGRALDVFNEVHNKHVKHAAWGPDAAPSNSFAGLGLEAGQSAELCQQLQPQGPSQGNPGSPRAGSRLQHGAPPSSSSLRGMAKTGATPADLGRGAGQGVALHCQQQPRGPSRGWRNLGSPLAGSRQGHSPTQKLQPRRPGQGNPGSPGAGSRPRRRAPASSSNLRDPARGTLAVLGLGAGQGMKPRQPLQPQGPDWSRGTPGSPRAGSRLGRRVPPGSSSPRNLARAGATSAALRLGVGQGMEPHHQLQPRRPGQGNPGSPGAGSWPRRRAPASSSNLRDPARGTLAVLGLGAGQGMKPRQPLQPQGPDWSRGTPGSPRAGSRLGRRVPPGSSSPRTLARAGATSAALRLGVGQGMEPHHQLQLRGPGRSQGNPGSPEAGSRLRYGAPPAAAAQVTGQGRRNFGRALAGSQPGHRAPLAAPAL
ncbi:uncharacterized protein LOC142014909 isoform X2 [Carettochelys insculpta]